MHSTPPPDLNALAIPMYRCRRSRVPAKALQTLAILNIQVLIGCWLPAIRCWQGLPKASGAEVR